jgi:alkanesulfonate monooxygenase SsuD/methylene tetrahydromethanopterin reductase-like flavin-dependent oxidoreductase (luciferase family)
MRLGVFLNSQHPAGDDPARRLAEVVEQVRLMRDLGFDSLWAGEHHATPGYHYFPLLPLLHRLAPEAGGMTVGTNLVLLPLHNPVEVAEVGAFLDVASGGRFVLGLGLGYRAEEFALFGVSMKERVSRLTEGVEIIRRLWTGDGVTHHGRHFRLDDVTIRPRPLQQPRPLILVGSQVDAGIARAARIADGWLVAPTGRVDEFARQAEAFAAARSAARLPPSEHVCRLLEVACGPDEETVARRIGPYLLDKYAAYLAWGIPGLTVDPAAPAGERLRRLSADRFCLGSPEQVTEALVAQWRAGVTHAAMRVSWPGMPQADVLAGLELLGRSVLPEVRRRTGAEGRRP